MSVTLQEPALLLSVKQVSALIGIAPRTLWRLASSGRFPRPDVKVGARIVKWRRTTVERWINVNSGDGANE